jgi:hypothetical protein
MISTRTHTERNVEVFVLAVFGRRYDTIIE